jgi:hypothetical protein
MRVMDDGRGDTPVGASVIVFVTAPALHGRGAPPIVAYLVWYEIQTATSSLHEMPLSLVRRARTGIQVRKAERKSGLTDWHGIGVTRSTVHLARGATTENWTLGGPSAASRRYEECRECVGGSTLGMHCEEHNELDEPPPVPERLRPAVALDAAQHGDLYSSAWSVRGHRNTVFRCSTVLRARSRASSWIPFGLG